MNYEIAMAIAHEIDPKLWHYYDYGDMHFFHLKSPELQIKRLIICGDKVQIFDDENKIYNSKLCDPNVIEEMKTIWKSIK